MYMYVKSLFEEFRKRYQYAMEESWPDTCQNSHWAVK